MKHVPGSAGGWERYAVLLASGACLCVFYRELIASGFDNVLGDDGDSLLNLHIVEHWYQWLFRGRGVWSKASAFYPLTNTLGYTDALFLFGLPHGLLRSLGMDLVTSYQLTLLLVHVAGFAAFYRVLRSALSLGRFAAVLGASLGMLNNAFYVSMLHTQLFAIGLVPFALLLTATFLRTADGPARTRRLAGASLAVLLPLLLYTGFYVAWFSVFFATLVLLVTVSADLVARTDARTVAALRWLWSHKAEMLAYAALALVALTPFAITYLPILREIGGRSYDEARVMLPSGFDFVNLGPFNFLWGSAFVRTFPDAESRPFAWELTKGVPPLTLLAFGCALAWGIRRKLASDRSTSSAASTPAVLVGMSVVVAWLLLLQVGDASAWRLVHGYFPGAGAIRAVFRFQHILLFGVAAVIACAFHAAWESSGTGQRPRTWRSVLVALAAVLFAEQLNFGEVYWVRKSALLAELQHVDPAPSPCLAFFVTAPESRKLPDYAVSTRAMLIAQRVGIPTLNGYTSGPPAGWTLYDVQAPGYVMRVGAWLESHRIVDGICSLSLETGKWERFDVSTAPKLVELEEALPDSGYHVRLELLDPPPSMQTHERRAVSVRVINLGSETLSGLGRYAVRLSYQWTDAEGHTEGFNYRKDLLGLLPPGESIVMSADLVAPDRPGNYRLDVDLVQELIAWFADKGGEPGSTHVSVVSR